MEKKSQLIEQLIYEMQLRNYSPRTIRTYGIVMTKLEKFSGCALDKITLIQFKDYLHRLITVENISVSLVNQYLSAFKILQVDVFKRDWEHFKIKRPRREKKLPVVLSVEEVERLISAATNLKHKAILMLAYSSGMRRQEVQKIKPSSIDSARMQVHVVQGKGKKDRYTILSIKALEVLRTYYKAERPLTFLFEPMGRKGRPMAEQTMAHIVKNNARKAGIKKNISFHTLRHSFATHLLEQGVNLRLIQQFMGHVSLKTTAGYLHLTHIDASSVVSPLDSMNI
jgi:site-specific recombinase XerD